MNHNTVLRIKELTDEIEVACLEIKAQAQCLMGPHQFMPTASMYTVSWASSGECKIIPFIKTLREWTHWGLADSKWAWDNRQIPNLPIAVAREIINYLKENGVEGVIICPVP